LGGGVTGKLNVDDTITVQNINLRGDVNAETANFRQGLDSTGNIATENIQYRNGIDNAERINTSSLRGTNGGTNITVNGQLKGSSFTTGNMAIDNGDVGVLDANIAQTLTVQGNVESANIGLGNVDVQTFGVCDNGC